MPEKQGEKGRTSAGKDGKGPDKYLVQRGEEVVEKGEKPPADVDRHHQRKQYYAAKREEGESSGGARCAHPAGKPSAQRGTNEGGHRADIERAQHGRRAVIGRI